MPIATPLTALLGIKHPILLAPMDIVAGSRLVTAVSRAGGFGILGGGYGERAWLEQETAKLDNPKAKFTLEYGRPMEPHGWQTLKNAELVRMMDRFRRSRLTTS